MLFSSWPIFAVLAQRLMEMPSSCCNDGKAGDKMTRVAMMFHALVSTLLVIFLIEADT